MEYPTVNDVIKTNKEIGADGTLINPGNLEFIINKVKNTKNLSKVAAILLYDIIQLHPFLDGNKRTAFTSMAAFLRINGRTFKSAVQTKPIELILINISMNKMTIEHK